MAVGRAGAIQLRSRNHIYLAKVLLLCVFVFCLFGDRMVSRHLLYYSENI